MKIGDKVMRTPHAYKDNLGLGSTPPEEATVIYIHPKGRYHTVVFENGIRESYSGTSVKEVE